jgi:hypothetical protein
LVNFIGFKFIMAESIAVLCDCLAMDNPARVLVKIAQWFFSGDQVAANCRAILLKAGVKPNDFCANHPTLATGVGASIMAGVGAGVAVVA